MKELDDYLDIEALAFMHADLRPALKLAEQKLIAAIRRGGNIIGNRLTLRVETVIMGGSLLGEYVVMKGEIPTRPRKLAVPGTVTWPRGLRPDVLKALAP